MTRHTNDPSDGKTSVARAAWDEEAPIARLRSRSFNQLMEAMESGNVPFNMVDLERCAQIAAELDAQSRAEGSLSRRVRELFERRADEIYCDDVDSTVDDHEAMARLARRYAQDCAARTQLAPKQVPLVRRPPRDE